MKCTELVIQDHVVLRRGLDILDGMVRRLEDGERIEIADVTAILKFLRLFGCEYHLTMEEKVLFPALLRAAPQESPLRRMPLQPGDGRGLIAGIEDALRSKRVADFLNHSRQLSLLFRKAFDEEDSVLGDIAEEWLSKEEDSALANEFEKNQKQVEVYANFSRLEWKYAAPKPYINPMSRERGLARGSGGSAAYR